MGLRIVKSRDAAGQAFLKLALYGKSGSGKTLTSLLLAEGLAEKRGKRILYIDTEDGTTFYRRDVPERTVHPKAFDFDLLLTKSLADVIEAVEEHGSEYGVIVVDSLTHLWEAAQASYTGKKTSSGSIPIQAWGQIKRPYKRVIQLGLTGDFDFILCGREGVLMEEGDDGEVKVVGARMKAEGETPYEPHILGRMVPEKMKDGSQTIRVFFEKDRSGVLAGKTFDWPNFSTFAPVIGYLNGEHQPSLPTTDAAAERDAEAQAVEDEKKKAEAQAIFSQIESAIYGARTVDELKAAWSLTSGKKTKLGDLFEQLEAAKDARKAALVREVA